MIVIRLWDNQITTENISGHQKACVGAEGIGCNADAIVSRIVLMAMLALATNPTLAREPMTEGAGPQDHHQGKRRRLSGDRHPCACP